MPVEAGFLNYVTREPLGVVGAIVPWNFPLLFTSWKMGPALAAGNTVVLKQAELTPLSTLRIAKLMAEVGIPPGVVNIVPGYGHTAGQYLAEHKGVSVVCDPWLIGSCYWRSWWNFPEPDPRLIENLHPQFI